MCYCTPEKRTPCCGDSCHAYVLTTKEGCSWCGADAGTRPGYPQAKVDREIRAFLHEYNVTGSHAYDAMLRIIEGAVREAKESGR